jgi:hypothetical protein
MRSNFHATGDARAVIHPAILRGPHAIGHAVAGAAANSNLIVNTDADQVIVATCGPHRPGHLPEISYESGGLENPYIRKHVCEILEGGEEAFRERARRLRVRM